MKTLNMIFISLFILQLNKMLEAFPLLQCICKGRNWVSGGGADETQHESGCLPDHWEKTSPDIARLAFSDVPNEDVTQTEGFLSIPNW